MEKLFTLGGYDVIALNERECKKYQREYPCLCAFYSTWAEENEGEDWDPNRDECEFETLQESIDWCVTYRCRSLETKFY